ncbi:MAG: hypothetical protein QOE91_988 [Gaiellaceae bacterium]|jgi:hypothetical protein|nr:hypothetical protein [Gaiellaceae bacterium]
MADATSTTRSGVLKRIALVAGGAVGLAFAGRETLAGETHAAPAALPANGKATALVLRARDVHLAVPGSVPGELPPTGIQAVPGGRIVDAKGKTLGSFSAANLPGVGTALQLHTFDLGDGTILGIGAAGQHDSPFAIVGGTGRFAGANGTYVAKQSPRELGGDGTAEFTLTLST